MPDSIQDVEDPAGPKRRRPLLASLKQMTTKLFLDTNSIIPVLLSILDLIRNSWWDKILVISCVIAVSLDPLFFYIVTINEEEKCLEMDSKLRTASLILRSLPDAVFVTDIRYRIHLATSSWQSILIDLLAMLPTPQVLVVAIFYKSRDFLYLKYSKILNFILFSQYVPRIYRLRRSFDDMKQKERTELQFKIAFNFFLYILAGHILGASWFFFSVQREMSCWHQTCLTNNTCGSTFKCKDNSSKNITRLAQLCPMNPTNATVFDFGIFANPLGTSSTTSTTFWMKFSYSFWWGVRNMSNFGTNLETSTYPWEVWFATLISVVGLILFVYLIGNNVQTFMQMKTVEAERKRVESEMKRQLADEASRIQSWLDRHHFLPRVREAIERKVGENLLTEKKLYLDNVSTLLSLLDSEDKRDATDAICLEMLRKVPDLTDAPDHLFYELSRRMETVRYPENTLIVKINDPIDRMIFITEGTVWTSSNSSTNSSPSRIIEGSIKQEGRILDEQLMSWLLSPDPDLNPLPISKETVKCHTEVEGFILKTEDWIGAAGALAQQKRIHSWLDRHHFLPRVREAIERKVGENLRTEKKLYLDNVLTLLSLLDSEDKRDAKDAICLEMLRKVPDLTDAPDHLFYELSRRMETVRYPENTLIVKINDPIDRMIFITDGTVRISSNSSTNSSPSRIIRGSIEQEGRIYDEQLMMWLFSPIPLYQLPISKATIKCHTKVEGFILKAEDLHSLENHFNCEDDAETSTKGGISSNVDALEEISLQ